jgi:hypothetical protein
MAPAVEVLIAAVAAALLTAGTKSKFLPTAEMHLRLTLEVLEREPFLLTGVRTGRSNSFIAQVFYK